MRAKTIRKASLPPKNLLGTSIFETIKAQNPIMTVQRSQNSSLITQFDKNIKFHSELKVF